MSALATIAWRNLWRNPRRSLLTLAALAFSCLLLVFMMSWQRGAYDAMIRAAVDLQTGPLEVVAADYPENPDMRAVIRDTPALIDRIEAIPGVRAAAPRAEGFALVSSARRSEGVLITAIDPGRDNRITTLYRTLRQGKFLGSAPDGAVIGSRLASNLQAGLGAELVVLGQGYEGETAAGIYHVVGIIETGQVELDRSLMLVPLATFRDQFGLGLAVHRILVEPDDFDRLTEVRAAVAAALPHQDPPLAAMTWDALLPGLRQGIALDQVSAYVLYAILLVVVTFSIANTFLMAVLERIHELGVLRAIGTTPRRLAGILFLETAFLALAGIAIGTLAGIAVTLTVQRVGIPMGEAGEIMRQYGMPARLYTRLSWAAGLLGPAFVFLVTCAAALPPVLRVRRLKPAVALAAP